MLQKEIAQAVASGDEEKRRELEVQVEALGGLKAYQRASLTGQGRERGGDSSVVLVDWLRNGARTERKRGRHGDEEEEEEVVDVGVRKKRRKGRGKEDLEAMREMLPEALNVLEVGCLSPDNEISAFVSALKTTSSTTGASITRIDLNSQHPLIKAQDFMERPLPRSKEEKFDLISLSLVLNYVPDAVGRGEMLRRTCEFLRHKRTSNAQLDPENDEEERDGKKDERGVFPALFLVLPAPCVLNSRYLTESHLSSIMSSLGYTLQQRKVSSKLVYYLWRWDGWPDMDGECKTTFPKKEISPGKGRNNFCIVIN